MIYRTVLLFGAPGSGKGTQGKILGTIPHCFHCACGDVFRNLTVHSELGRTFIEYSSRGELVPDEYTVKLWKKSVEASTQSGRFDPEHDILVLDGIPRNATQAEMLKDTLDVKAICYLVCDDFEKLVQRLHRRALHENRLDDMNLDTIKRRMTVYEKESKGVIDYYGDSLVHRIDSSQEPLNVSRDILEVFAKL